MVFGGREHSRQIFHAFRPFVEPVHETLAAIHKILFWLMRPPWCGRISQIFGTLDELVESALNSGRKQAGHVENGKSGDTVGGNAEYNMASLNKRKDIPPLVLGSDIS